MPLRPSRLKARLASPRMWLGAGAALVLAAANAPAVLGFATQQYHAYEIETDGYKAARGHWDVVAMPAAYQLNSIHAVLLRTGKVLLIAGSGNNIKHFEGGTFSSTLWDPVKNTFKKIDTPKDMFCAGHAQLPDGKVLIAGGTARYEVLEGNVKRAGGTMLVKNEDPDQDRTFPKGTVFRSTSGHTYRSQLPVHVPAAHKTIDPATRRATVSANEARVYVEADQEGPQGITNTTEQYEIQGLAGEDGDNFYGIANKLGLDKKDFQGIKDAYEFDPATEKYTRVDPMSEARWYPTLLTLSDGKVLATSGLDDVGQVVPGKNEIYDPARRTWSKAPTRYFPTYPSLFLMNGGKVFYSGSNSGYGPADKGRVPGVWDLGANTFTAVPGLKDADTLETSGSVLLPPAQDQKVMVFGGGGVGESKKATARTAIVDLKAARPAYVPGPDLAHKTRYLNPVLMPDDTVFTTGGSGDYRGRGQSDILAAQFYDPKTNTFRAAADPTVARDYHTEALLLPDGRVAVFGSDPLYGDENNTKPGTFEQRVEVYTPPSLYRDHRPALGAGPRSVRRGESVTFHTADAARIRTARLIHPGSATHVTDFDQRSVALDVSRTGDTVTLTVPKDPALVPAGWHMIFVTDEHGTPSQATWMEIG
ncbi:galactose oxidase early set domain-containing protein [Streptomyces sp. NBC_01431]|uniref:galactose oxidase early set domain-containing protein n=1 Tax=Streptomyces sp. NBC_01431 TaxID=2903863 RepID=UPI002E381756|nr:galactose oxidase early set domain-containing protein [Streptomyces sp. NBC_01431]